MLEYIISSVPLGRASNPLWAQMHSGVHVAGVPHVLQSTGTGLSRTILRASRTVREVEEIGTTGQRTVHACREPSRVGHSAFELLKKPLEPIDTWTSLKLIL